MRRAVGIDANGRGAETRAKRIATQSHTDPVLHRSGRCAGFVPFFTKADPLRAFEDALL